MSLYRNRTPPKRRYLQQHYRAEELDLDDCHSCEGTGRVETIEHGDQSHWDTCQHCSGKGNFAVDFDDEMSDKWLETWHGSNKEKDQDSGSVRSEFSER